MTAKQTPSDAYLSGKLLQALPAIGDPRFDHSILAMVRHDDDGAMALAIGAPSDVPASMLFEQMGVDVSSAPLAAMEQRILVGGPVEQELGFVIHSPEWTESGSIAVHEHFAVTVSVDILSAIARGEGPRWWQIAMGYAGWGPGQLEDEFGYHAWYATQADDDVMNRIAPERRWHAALARDGINPALLVGQGGSA